MSDFRYCACEAQNKGLPNERYTSFWRDRFCEKVFYLAVEDGGGCKSCEIPNWAVFVLREPGFFARSIILC